MIRKIPKLPPLPMEMIRLLKGLNIFQKAEILSEMILCGVEEPGWWILILLKDGLGRTIAYDIVIYEAVDLFLAGEEPEDLKLDKVMINLAIEQYYNWKRRGVAPKRGAVLPYPPPFTAEFYRIIGPVTADFMFSRVLRTEPIVVT